MTTCQLTKNQLIDSQQANSPNQLIHGDNLTVMKALLPDLRGKIRLAYVDPPFATNRTFRIAHNTHEQTGKSSNIAYQDTLDHDSYLAFIRERLTVIHELLSEDGTLYVHLDPRIAPYVQIMLDEIFGFERFHKQIVWKRTTSHPNAKSFACVHDTLVFYPKNKDFFFSPAYEPYSESYIREYYRFKEDNGNEDSSLGKSNRWYSPGDLTGKALKTAHDPRYQYEWNGHTKIWRCPRETMVRLQEENKLHYTSSGLPRIKRFLDEMPGLAPSDVWADIPPVHPRSQEFTGYPTQKPEKLLERIIRSSSQEGDITLDPFCGSGTTLTVAERLNRRWIGIDESPVAIEFAGKREGLSVSTINTLPLLGKGDQL